MLGWPALTVLLLTNQWVQPGRVVAGMLVGYLARTTLAAMVLRKAAHPADARDHPDRRPLRRGPRPCAAQDDPPADRHRLQVGLTHPLPHRITLAACSRRRWAKRPVCQSDLVGLAFRDHADVDRRRRVQVVGEGQGADVLLVGGAEELRGVQRERLPGGDGDGDLLVDLDTLEVRVWLPAGRANSSLVSPMATSARTCSVLPSGMTPTERTGGPPVASLTRMGPPGSVWAIATPLRAKVSSMPELVTQELVPAW